MRDKIRLYDWQVPEDRKTIFWWVAGFAVIAPISPVWGVLWLLGAAFLTRKVDAQRLVVRQSLARSVKRDESEPSPCFADRGQIVWKR